MKCLAIFVFTLATALAFAIGKTIPFRDIHADDENFNRITNGYPAYNGQFPYQVGLSIHGAWCGGTLISTIYILTTAQCVSKTAYRITAYLGSVTLNGGISRVINSVKVHGGFDPDTLVNDIAIVEIPAVVFSSTIASANLPTFSGFYSSYAGATVTISGWGKTSDTSEVSTELHYATATVITNDECAKSYGDVLVNSGTLCVSTTNGKSACNGDSGGPAVYNNNLLIGITSFGHSSGCTNGYPVVFTRVTQFRRWILTSVGI